MAIALQSLKCYCEVLSHCASCTGGQHNDETHVVDEVLRYAQDMEEVQRDVLAQAEARAEKAESEAAAEKEQRKRIMEAAANGALPLSAASPGMASDLASCSALLHPWAVLCLLPVKQKDILTMAGISSL